MSEKKEITSTIRVDGESFQCTNYNDGSVSVIDRFDIERRSEDAAADFEETGRTLAQQIIASRRQ